MEQRYRQSFDSDSDDSENEEIESKRSHSVSSVHYQPLVQLDYRQAHYFSFLLQHLHIPSFSFPSIAAIEDCTQYNLGQLVLLQDSMWREDIQQQIPIWRVMNTLFSRVPKFTSFGAISLHRHTLNQLWKMITERGDLLLLAEMVVLCRLYSRINKEDLFQYVTGCKNMDVDNILMMVAEVLDRKQLFFRKMEFLKFVLNTSKFQIPLVPTCILY